MTFFLSFIWCQVWATNLSDKAALSICESTLQISFEISNGLQGLQPAVGDDLQTHALPNSLSELNPNSKAWASLAKKYGFGPELKGIQLSNLPVRRDGEPLGVLGFTSSRKAVLVSSFLEAETDRLDAIEPTTLKIQSLLLTAGVVRPVFGWFILGKKIYLVRELIAGWSVHRFNRYEYAVRGHDEEFRPQLTLKHLQGVEKVLQFDFARAESGEQILLASLRMSQLWRDQTVNTQLRPITGVVVKKYLGMLNWVFGPNGEVFVDGLNQFTSVRPRKDENEVQAWLIRNGAEVWLRNKDEIGIAGPTYATWARYYFGLFLNSEDLKKYLFSLIAEKPEEMVRINYLMANLSYTENPRLNYERDNFLSYVLFGGTEQLRALSGQRFAQDNEKPYPRPTNLRFASTAKLKNHSRHAPEFNLQSADEYLKFAQQTILSPPTADRIYAVRKNGDYMIRDEKEEWFAVISVDGIIKTFFRPNPKFKNFSLNENYLTDDYYWFSEFVKEFKP